MSLLHKSPDLKLTKQIYTPENDCYSFHFSKAFDKEIILNFTTLKHERVNRIDQLEKGKIYFVSTFINEKEYALYRGYTENSLFGLLNSGSNKLSGRLFIYLPNIKKAYTSKSNLNGVFFIAGESLQEASVAEFNSKASDILFLTNFEKEDCENSNSVEKLIEN